VFLSVLFFYVNKPRYNAVVSKFKERVLEVVSAVPRGRVVSYGQVAWMVGKPRAAIQVGWVLHQFGDKVPWWRVINREGRISTTCEEHTAFLQKQLLEDEGIVVDKDLLIDFNRFRFVPGAKLLAKFELDDVYIRHLTEKFGL
jgi:methylated-DNA-protein-cysteine methyltransferase related protein